MNMEPLHKFKEINQRGLWTGRLAYVADVDSFHALPRDHEWVAVEFDPDQEGHWAGFDQVSRHAHQNGYAIVRRNLEE